MLTLIWREQALDDIDRTLRHIGAHDRAAADRLGLAIADCAQRFSEHPLMYRAGRVRETREAVVNPNYILIYRVTEETVEVLSLVHSRQQYP